MAGGKVEIPVGILCATNTTKHVVLAQRVEVATSLWARCRGLLGKERLPQEAGLYLAPCRSVHTWFMRFPIDVLFLDQQGIVINRATMPSWRISPWMRLAAGVLELPAGTLERTGTQVGDRISFEQT